MSSSAILDPIAKAYYKKEFGGGSAVENGYRIEWDGNTEGLECVDLAHLGLTKYYKVSNKVIPMEMFVGAFFRMSAVFPDCIVENNPYVLVGNKDICYIKLDGPAIVSGKAGTYPLAEGVNVTIPSDGVYFMKHHLNGTDFYPTLFFNSKNDISL